MFTDSHRVEIYWDHGDWQIEVMPTVGRCCYLWYDIQDNGRHQFKVSVDSPYFTKFEGVEHWIKNDCDQFIVNGELYLDLESASKAVWDHEIRNAQSMVEIEDILECVEDWPEVKSQALARKCRIARLDHIKRETKATLAVLSISEQRMANNGI